MTPWYRRIVWPRFLCFLALCVLALGGLVYGGYRLLRPVSDAAMEKLYPRQYQEDVERYAKEFELEESFVYAVCKIESNFDPNAQSDADARGLMQLTKPAFRWVQYRLGEEDGVSYEQIYEPQVALRYGCALFSLLRTELADGDEGVLLAAYHAGLGAVQGWLEDPEYSSDGKTLDKIPYSDTNWYVTKVLETRDMYEKLYG